MIAEYTNYEGITEWDVTNQMGRQEKVRCFKIIKIRLQAKTTLEVGLKKTIKEMYSTKFND